MSATFPPLSGGSGPSSAGLVVGQSVASFIPDASGNAPTGWAFFDGMLSGSYDQGAALSDAVAALYESGYTRPAEYKDNLRFYEDAVITGYVNEYLQFSDCYLRTDVLAGEVAGAVLFYGGNKEVLLYQGGTSFAGTTLDSYITKVLSLDVLSATGNDLDLLLTVRTATGNAWVLRSQYLGIDETLLPSSVVNQFKTEVSAYVSPFSERCCVLSRSATEFAVVGGGSSFTVNKTSGAVAAYAAELHYTLQASSSSALSDVLVCLEPAPLEFGLTYTTKALRLVADEFVEFAYSSLPDWFVRPDGSALSVNSYGVFTLETDGSLKQRAGRYPQLSKELQSREFKFVGISMPTDYLNEQAKLQLHSFDRSVKWKGDGTDPIATAEYRLTFGPLFSSFVRKAVYTG